MLELKLCCVCKEPLKEDETFGICRACEKQISDEVDELFPDDLTKGDY